MLILAPAESSQLWASLVLPGGSVSLSECLGRRKFVDLGKEGARIPQLQTIFGT